MILVWFLGLLVFGFVNGDVGLPRFPKPVEEEAPVLDISQEDITKAFAYAKDQLQSRIESENKYIEADPGNSVSESELSVDVRNTGVITPKSIQLYQIQEQLEDASRFLSSKYSLPLQEILLGLRNYSLPENVPVVQQCKKLKEVSSCDEKYKYRAADGSCNSLTSPVWGQAVSCYNRMMKQVYSDGLSTPRLARDGSELPNSRFVSLTVTDAVSVPSQVTQMAIFFAQFICHDFTQAASHVAGDNGTYLMCCPKSKPSVPKPSICYPISVAEDDLDFANQTCMAFVRAASCSEDCKLGTPRRHVNQQTAFIDGSAVYGTSEEVTKSFRTLKGGSLLNQYSGKDELPPPSFDPNNDQCSKSMKDNHTCIQTGDFRAVMQPGMTTQHILWFREHNRIAKILSKDYPQLSDEVIFQEARRVVGAEMQVIIYKELLPILLGPELMTFFQLNVLTDGYSTYNPDTDPRILTEYAAGAGRFGHTMVQSWFDQFGKDGQEEENVDLVKNSYTIPCFYDGKMDSITRGLYHQKSQAFDRHFVDLMTRGLIRAPGKEDGVDHAAFNIQRGRDTGLPSYADIVKFCYNRTLSTFDDLTLLMSVENAQKLQKAYSDVNDIDFYMGGFLETPRTDAVLGPSFACVVGLQYHNMKFGDRFFLEHGGQAGSFTQGQLKELRKCTPASIVCQNTGAGIVSPNIFRPIDSNNPLMDCGAIESPDMKNWMDK